MFRHGALPVAFSVEQHSDDRLKFLQAISLVGGLLMRLPLLLQLSFGAVERFPMQIVAFIDKIQGAVAGRDERRFVGFELTGVRL